VASRVEFIKNRLTFYGKADPMAKLMMTTLAAFGEFERGLIRGRQREGIAIAKSKGVYKGRKKALSTEQAAELLQCASSGMPECRTCPQLRHQPGDALPLSACW
jgi:DNA invertase Pin-like site-specific DNA recombinase